MRTILTAFVLTVLGFVYHEAAHGFAGKLLGYEMEISINRATAIGGYIERSHLMLVSFAGPLATLALAGVGAFFARTIGSTTGFLIVFTSLLQRLLAQAVSLSNPNDEMRVSLELGIGAWTLPAAMLVLFLLFTAWGARGAKPSIWVWVLGFIGANIGITAVVFGEPYLPSFIW